MRIDWQVIKSLLSKFEDESITEDLKTVGQLPDSIQLEDFEKREELKNEARNQEKIIFGHLLLCLDGDFVEGISIKTDGCFNYTYGMFSPRLTLKGHELLEKLRNQTVWARLKKGAVSLGAPITVETISAIATRVINEV